MFDCKQAIDDGLVYSIDPFTYLVVAYFTSNVPMDRGSTS
jgi:hypothetical protein